VPLFRSKGGRVYDRSGQLTVLRDTPLLEKGLDGSLTVFIAFTVQSEKLVDFHSLFYSTLSYGGMHD
jgi:hypothetical protein